MSNNEPDTILRPAEVAKRLGVSRSTLYSWDRSLPGFPKKIKLGPQVSGWRWSEITAWLDSRKAA